MKKIVYILCAIVVLASCSGSGKRFRLNGEIKGLQGGEIYVYSPTAQPFGRVDTIRISDGVVSYSTPLVGPTPLVLVFENSSEQVVFAEPGLSVDLKADATHLRNMKFEGGKANELFSDFRKKTMAMPEGAIQNAAEEFILAHPESNVSLYLLSRYFFQTGAKTSVIKRLTDAVSKAQSDNADVAALAERLALLQTAREGSKAPSFTTRNLGGAERSLKSYDGHYLLLTFTATWTPQWMQLRTTLRDIANRYSSRLKQNTVWLDVNVDAWKNIQHGDSLAWDNCIETSTFESQPAKAYGVRELPTFVLISPSGRVLMRTNATNSLQQKVAEYLK